MTLILDSAALIALERGERTMWTRVKAALRDREPPVTHAGVIGQVWRSGARQARLAQAVAGLDVRALDPALGRAGGELLGRAGMSDIVDATVVLLARNGDAIVTADVDDLGRLAAASGRAVRLLRP